ncbi:HlyD family efflux transporter periplasmic adaptor subunit [Candidatus Stoquefichus massiliensis]|uniref:HlyD family efflux transporter periplasmic adaptor subunit n=1 Tax=Candidatus Stoquefichus massiliensis TaxID=1470350 RepID=UPI000485B7AB|nr:HlyD family efflux transporter periplasmic adaptor subunit [Candidatus Stoquefichus massiliensis]
MKLYQKSELNDSRIFFDKQPPMFLTIFIVFILFMIIFAIWMSSWMSKSYIVEASGTITTSDNIYISSLSDGVLTNLKIKEGTFVKKGDVLFEISTGSEGIQYSALQRQISNIKDKITAINKYIDSLNKQKNKMYNSGIEQEYYEKVRYYLSSLDDENQTKENNQNSLKQKEEKKTKKEQEIQSLKDQISKLKDTEEDKIKKEELNSSLETKQSELESLQEEINQLNQTSSSQAEQTKIQLISEAGNTRTTLQSTLVELEGQLKAYQSQDALTTVEASQNGYVHYLSTIKEGVTIQKGQTVAEISTNKDDQMIVEAYIKATDISKVQLNNDVKVAINGVNIQKYGTLNGKLVSIDSGTLTQETEQGNIVLYKCLVSLDNKQLHSTDGAKIDVIKSMPVVARIVYEKETYLDWLLELLSFRN